jgi:hypothetical protein
MSERKLRWAFSGLTLIFTGGLLAFLRIWGWAFTNDISNAQCTPKLTCQGGPCLLVWRDWPNCDMGRACVSFRAQTGLGGTFKECVYSKNGSDWCYSGPDQPPPPVVVTCGGQYWFCNCRDQVHGDCQANNTPSGDPPGICDCMSFNGTNGTHGVTNMCT